MTKTDAAGRHFRCDDYGYVREDEKYGLGSPELTEALV